MYIYKKKNSITALRFFFSSRRRHTISYGDWSSDVCSSDLFTGRLLRATYFDPGKVTEADVDQYYAPVAQPEYERALVGVLRQFRFAALEGRLDRIAAPTLVLWGEEDRWVPIGLGRALAAGITRSAFVSVPRAGHSVQEESPEDMNHLVIRFLKDGLPRVPADLAFGH